MPWTKREATDNLVVLGDAEGNVRKVGGLLAAVEPDRRFPDNKRFTLVQHDGSVKSLAGSAVINSQLGVSDVGSFVKLSFLGWEKGRNGQFKNIEVQVYDGEATDEMKAWPRYAELHAKKPKAAEQPPLPEQPDEEDDDDLPF